MTRQSGNVTYAEASSAQPCLSSGTGYVPGRGHSSKTPTNREWTALNRKRSSDVESSLREQW